MSCRRSRQLQARAVLASEPAAATTTNARAKRSLSENTAAAGSVGSPPPGVALHAWIKAQSKAAAPKLSTRSTLVDASMLQRLMAANLQLGADHQPRTRQRGLTCSHCGAVQSSMGGRSAGCRACGEGLSLSNNARAFAESTGLLGKEEIAAPLSERQWDAVESNCAARADGTCPICMEPFSRGHQVMLSCSHMFHKTCLQSFEKFVKMEARTCPLCRHRNYQKKLTVKGTEAHMKRCATLIQAYWRGHKARQAYRQLLKQYYSTGRGNPVARRKFFEREFAICTTSIEAETCKRTTALDELMADMDRTIRENQQLATLLDHVASTNAANQHRLRASYQHDSSTRVDWDAVALNALQRCDDEICAICMGGFRDGKAMSLLSCSHVFHTVCISSFEQFNLQAVDTCPVCRSRYQSKTIDSNFFASVAT